MATAKRPRHVVQRHTLQLEHQTVVVIADTHSHPHPGSVELAASLKPDAIVHAGDIGDRTPLSAFEKLAPLIMVRGNIDGRDPDTPDSIVLDVSSSPDVDPLRVLLTHIALYGPRIRKDVAVRANREKAELVICGHSHIPFIGQDKGLLVFNPGSIGPRRFHLPITLGVLSWTDAGLQLRHMDCETGQPWSPGPALPSYS